MGYSSGTKVGTEWHSGNTGSPILLGAFGRIVAQADGVWTLFNNAQNSFTRLQFGGTSNLFPCLKLNAPTLQCRLADDSGLAGFQCAKLVTGSAPTSFGAGTICWGGTVGTVVGAAGAAAALPATPTGYIDINVNGVAQKVPYYN